jgi:hypothetical protein
MPRFGNANQDLADRHHDPDAPNKIVGRERRERVSQLELSGDA